MKSMENGQAAAFQNAVQGGKTMGILTEVFGKLGKISMVTWIAVGALVALGIILLIISKGKQKWTTRLLAEGALTAALSFLLSYIKVFSMPLGGSITLCSMLPILMFAYAHGLPRGMLVGLGYGLLQLLQTQPKASEIFGTLLDYPIAFALLALSALARKLPKSYSIFAGILIGGLGRLTASYLSGVVFYGIWAPYNPLLYSFVYNISYIGPEIALCALVVLIPSVRRALERVYAVRA